MLHLPHAPLPNGHDSPTATAAHQARNEALSSVRSGGATALARLLLAVRPGSPLAGLEMGSLIRALPGVGPLGAQDLLRLAHLEGSDLLGCLTQSQRRQLCASLARVPYVLGSNPVGTPGP